jgi:hypothetical protein
MTLVEWILLVVGVLAVVGLAALIVLAVAVGLARRPDRASVAVIDPDGLDEYFDRGAAFAVTVVERTPLSASEVFGRLAGRPYLSSLPFLQGPDWLVSPTSGGVGVGARRTMSGTIYSVSEQVICYEQDSQIALTGTDSMLRRALHHLPCRPFRGDRGDVDGGGHAGLGGVPAVALGCAVGRSGTRVRLAPHAAAGHVPGSARSGVSASDQFVRSADGTKDPVLHFIYETC